MVNRNEDMKPQQAEVVAFDTGLPIVGADDGGTTAAADAIVDRTMKDKELMDESAADLTSLLAAVRTDSVPLLAATQRKHVASPEQLLRTCFHEAGHAVLFHALTGETVDGIQIHASGGGATSTGRVERIVEPPLRGRRLALFCIAGDAAALRHEEPACVTWASDDRVEAVLYTLGDEQFRDDSDFRQAKRACRSEAKVFALVPEANRLIDEHWQTIERLANAMHRRTQEQPFESISFYWFEMDPLVRNDLTEEELADMAKRARRPL